MIGEVLAKNKFICLLTSPLFHALQYEIINQIYLYVTTCLLAIFGILFIDSRTVIHFQTSRFIISDRRSISRRPVSCSRVFIYESGGLPRLLVSWVGCHRTRSETTSSSLRRQWPANFNLNFLILFDNLSSSP